jgi:hypothetical protein
VFAQSGDGSRIAGRGAVHQLLERRVELHALAPRKLGVQRCLDFLELFGVVVAALRARGGAGWLEWLRTRVPW